MLQRFALSIWQEDEGALSWEWVMIVTLTSIGIISGVSAARDGAIDEMGDVAQSFVAVDQSYTIDFPLEILIDGESLLGATDSLYEDEAIYSDCGRVPTPLGQGGLEDNF